MTLFFLRRDCAGLSDFHSDRFGELSWWAAASLFGVRDGWLNLRLKLQARFGLSAAVSHRMERRSHRIAGTGIDLGEPPAGVRPPCDLFGDGSTWRSGEKAEALELARVQEWDCVHTRISLGQGSCRVPDLDARSVPGGSGKRLERPRQTRDPLDGCSV